MNIPRLCEAHRGFLVLQSAQKSIGEEGREAERQRSVGSGVRLVCGAWRAAGPGSAVPAYHINTIVHIFT